MVKQPLGSFDSSRAHCNACKPVIVSMLKCTRVRRRRKGHAPPLSYFPRRTGECNTRCLLSGASKRRPFVKRPFSFLMVVWTDLQIYRCVFNVKAYHYYRVEQLLLYLIGGFIASYYRANRPVLRYIRSAYVRSTDHEAGK